MFGFGKKKEAPRPEWVNHFNVVRIVTGSGDVTYAVQKRFDRTSTWTMVEDGELDTLEEAVAEIEALYAETIISRERLF